MRSHGAQGAQVTTKAQDGPDDALGDLLDWIVKTYPDHVEIVMAHAQLLSERAQRLALAEDVDELKSGGQYAGDDGMPKAQAGPADVLGSAVDVFRHLASAKRQLLAERERFRKVQDSVKCLDSDPTPLATVADIVSMPDYVVPK